MRRKRNKTNETTVSLFPFLAVLICTLGVLILMLVMAVKSAEVEAKQVQQESDSKQLAKIEAMEDRLNFHTMQIEGLSLVRPEAVNRMKQSRQKRSHLESEIRKLKKAFEDLGQQIVENRKPIDISLQPENSFSERDAEKELEKLRRQLEDTEKKIVKKQDQIASQTKTRTQIVPYRGNSGTLRAPIFLECTDDVIELHPYQIRFPKKEFVLPPVAGNPIDSALLAIRDYHIEHQLQDDHGSPYPLIVVRPDGAESFVVVRNAMKSWDDEFGYELVPETTELDFGQADPQLKAKLESVVATARMRQAQRVRVEQARSQSGGGGVFGSPGTRQRFETPDSKPGLVASSSHGGFVYNRSEYLSSNSKPDSSDYRNAYQKFSGGEGQRDPKTEQSESSSGSQSNESRSDKKSAGKGGPGNYGDPSLAQTRGQGWALPSHSPGATGYVRPIRVTVDVDAVSVRDFQGQIIEIPFDGPSLNAIDPLVSQVWKIIDSWGLAGTDGYWKPQLSFRINRGGEVRFEQLKTLLFESGLGVEAEQ
ncbi:MAG: hypothetical protein AAF939_18930 [Planctomycetota bacterium]